MDRAHYYIQITSRRRRRVSVFIRCTKNIEGIIFRFTNLLIMLLFWNLWFKIWLTYTLFRLGKITCRSMSFTYLKYIMDLSAIEKSLIERIKQYLKEKPNILTFILLVIIINNIVTYLIYIIRLDYLSCL